MECDYSDKMEENFLPQKETMASDHMLHLEDETEEECFEDQDHGHYYNKEWIDPEKFRSSNQIKYT